MPAILTDALLTELKPESETLPQTPAALSAELEASLRASGLVLAPAPPAQENRETHLTVAPVREKATAPTRRIVRRRARLDWEAIGVILLMLACAGVGLYRLIWMGQF